MVELTYAVILCAAIGSSWLVIRDVRRLILSGSGMVLWGLTAFNSLHVDPSFGSGARQSLDGMFAFAIGAMLLTLVYLIGAAIDELPQVGADGGFGGGQMDRVKRTLRGNNRL
jgi:hypothetical protein